MEESDLFEFTNENFGKIRTVKQDNTVLFCANDVATALGYKNTRGAISKHCPHVVKCDIGVKTGKKSDGTEAYQIIQMSFIPEGDLYRLVASSKLPTAQKFESWIFDTVLPSIRKTGSYSIDSSLQSEIIHAQNIAIENASNLASLSADVAKNNMQDIQQLKEQARKETLDKVDAMPKIKPVFQTPEAYEFYLKSKAIIRSNLRMISRQEYLTEKFLWGRLYDIYAMESGRSVRSGAYIYHMYIFDYIAQIGGLGLLFEISTRPEWFRDYKVKARQMKRITPIKSRAYD